MEFDDAQDLLVWYERAKRTLPWRRTRDPYAVLVSEFMLQQTTVAAVTPKYLAWLERFPTFEALATAAEDEVLAQWSGLGYYQRARRLHAVAREVSASGTIPDRYESLLKLPGLGPYTAAAVASICFGLPHLAVDTNVIRVLYRYYGIFGEAKDRRGHAEIGERVSACLARNSPGQFNQALMELGATLCGVRATDCSSCPLRRRCRARRLPEGPTALPLPSPRKKPRPTPGKVLLVEREQEGSVLLMRGTALGVLERLYQPPIVFDEVRSGPLEAALRRLTSFASQERWTLRYGLSGRRLDLECERWRLPESQAGEVASLVEAAAPIRWWRSGETPAPPLSSLTRRVLQRYWESR